MICANCGTENDPGRKFCKECASRLAVACPSCGTLNPPDAKFCGECATSLDAGAATSAPASASAGQTENRHAVGTAVAERLSDPSFGDTENEYQVADGIVRSISFD